MIGDDRRPWVPRTIEDSVDAGVHPVVAAMRLAQKATPEGQFQKVQGMDLKATPWVHKDAGSDGFTGYTYNKRNGPASAVASTNPVQQIGRLTGMGMNPQDFFKQAKQSGTNPVAAILNKSGPDLPGKEDRKKDKKSKKKDKKSKKKKDKKKKDKKSKKKKKAKKKKDSSSSSSSSGSSSSSSGEDESEKSKSGGEKKKQRKAESWVGVEL